VITWPFQWFASMAIDNRYSPEASVGLLSPIPVLFIHGDADSIVPLHHSQRLFELAGFPKQLWVVPGAGHIQAIKDKQLRARLTEYLVDSVSSLHGAVAATP
jgi:hypothetical protein